MCSALEYPRCTQVSHGVYQTDCGSTAWAFSVFIAWNLLSMVRACMVAPLSRMADLFLLLLVHLRQHVHWCGRGEFLVRLPVHRWRLEVDHATRNTCVQKSLGPVRGSKHRSVGASEARSVPRCTSSLTSSCHPPLTTVVETQWGL